MDQSLSAQSKRNLWRAVVKYKHFYVLILPAVICFIVVNYIPMAGIVIAFKKYNVFKGIFGSPWRGLHYFERMWNSPDIVNIIRNTLIISFAKLAVMMPASILFAVLLNELGVLFLKKTFQTISYLPHFISWVVAAGLVRALLALEGPVNVLVRIFGADPVMFLGVPAYFVPILVLSTFWKEIGWGSIIYLAAISGIDPQLYEAAEIDGANRWHRMMHITIPSIMPVIVIVLLLRVGRIFDAGFDQIYNLYNPLVYSVGDILDTYIFRLGIEGLQFSYTAAIGITRNLVGLALLLTANYMTKRLTQDQSGI